MKSAPLASIIIPTYNYGRYICEAIDSVLASDFPQNEIEIIVVDDGSTDDTLDKLRVYRERIRCVCQVNQGKALATRVGIERARGKYVFNLDADDLFLPEKLEKVVNIFESDEEVSHVGHPALCWDLAAGTRASEKLPNWLLGRKIRGQEVLLEFYKKRILFGGGSTFSARAEVLKRFPIPEEVDMYVDEYLILATLNNGYSVFIERPLSVWRVHGENFSKVGKKKKYPSLAKTKDDRSRNSMNAVLSYVLTGDFKPEMKTLYTLKTKVSRIAMSEQAGEKSSADVLDLLKHLMSTFRVFGKESFEIMRSYTVLNRTLPTPVLQLAKRVSNRSA